MNTTDILIVQISTLTILYYKLNYHFYIKKIIGVRPFRKTPIDCFSCSNFWYSLSYAFIIFEPLQAIKFIGTITLAAILIETNIQR